MQDDRDEPRFSELNEVVIESRGAGRVNSLTSNRGRAGLVLGVLALLLLAALAWFYLRGVDQPVAPPPAIAATTPESVSNSAPTPDIPIAESPPLPESVALAEATESSSLTFSLENSDALAHKVLVQAGISGPLGPSLAGSDLVQRGAAAIDALSRGFVPYNVLPLPRPTGKISILEGQGRRVIDPASYARYDAYAQAVGELNSDHLASIFHQFRPLLEEAYALLGHPPKDFDNTLIRALDQVIATPDIQGGIVVEKKVNTYLFASPELEALPPLQKQLLRMGPDNARVIRAQAEKLRTALLAQ